MTECEKCPYWGPDKHGSHTCLTKYCIDDPMADTMAATDEYWEEMQAEYDALEEENRQIAEAYQAEYEAFQEEMAPEEVR